MIHKTTVLIIMALFLSFTVGCQQASEPEEASPYQNIAPEEAREWLESDMPPILLDVRTPEENRNERIPDSLLIPLDELEETASSQLPDREAPILIYCRSGRRSVDAALILADMGYEKLYNLGGIIDWPYETISGGEPGTSLTPGEVRPCPGRSTSN